MAVHTRKKTNVLGQKSSLPRSQRPAGHWAGIGELESRTLLSTVTFAAALNINNNNPTRSVTTADFNSDGKIDIATANSTLSTVSVMLNTTAQGATTASFAAKQDFTTGTNPYSLTAADVNGDGRMDLIAANYLDSTISVLLNTTAAGATTVTFAAQQTFNVGLNPYSVAVGDFNGDGKIDIATANATGSSVSVLLNTTTVGTSTPTFAAKQDFAASGISTSVAVGDINGDGKLDLVAGNVSSNIVSIFLNTTALGATTAAFAVRQDIPTGGYSIFASLVDVNADGKLDVAVADKTDHFVQVLLNTTVANSTTVSFATNQSFSTGSGTQSLASGDFNGDGVTDIVAADFGANAASVLINATTQGSSTASFAASQDFSAANGSYSVAVADFNNDGRPDVVVGNLNAGSVSVLLNTSPSLGPTNITLAGATGQVNEPDGSSVGTLSTTEWGTGNTFTYALVTGTGSADNTSFTISGNQLLSAIGFNYPVKASYSVRVQGTDQNSLSVQKVLTVTVTDTAARMSHANFVYGLYRDILGRGTPAASEVSYWTAQLDAGTLNYAGVSRGFTSSLEYYGNIVQDLFQTYLHRNVDTTGLTAFVNQLVAGANSNDIRAGILGSNEYYVDAGNTDDAFIDALYQQFLSRQPEPAGLTYWKTILAKTNGRMLVATGIADSNENLGDLVTTFYTRYLSRTPDQSGLDYWINRLNQGLSQPDLVTGFTTSPEYLAKLGVTA